MKKIVMIAAALLFIAFTLGYVCGSAHSKNWDRNQAETEENKRRNDFLSKAGTVQAYVTDAETRKLVPLEGQTTHINCCGFGDAYEADVVEIEVDENSNVTTYAVLTCNDPDNCVEVLGETKCEPDVEGGGIIVCQQVGAKVVRLPGDKWKITADKALLNYDPVNLTGHGWIYLNPSATGPDGRAMVICWVRPGGL